MTCEAVDVNKSFPAGSPWQVLRTFLPFKTQDHRQWWDKTASVLGRALEIAKYSVQAQYQHLLLHYATVTTAAGPFPNEKGDNITWLGFGSEVGTVELSFNYQNDSKCTVRVGGEPIGPYAGTDIDLTNEWAAATLLQNVKSMNSSVDIDCFNWFNQTAVLSNGEASQAKNGNCQYQTQRWITFDLKHSGDFTGKAYFFNRHKAKFVGMDVRSHIFTTIRGLDCLSHFHTPLSLLENFFSRPGRESLLPEMSFSVDCVDPKKTRLKVYAQGILKSLSAIRDCWTLDGRINGEHVDRSFEIWERLWRQLVHDDPCDVEMKHLIEFNWEFSPGRHEPIPKIYLFPMHISDDRVVQVLNGIFEDLGWQGHVQMQREFMSEAWYCTFRPSKAQLVLILSSYRAGKDLKTSKNFIKIISFAYIPGNGPYITTYGNPTLSDVE